MLILKGTVIHALSPSDLQILPNATVVVDQSTGIILSTSGDIEQYPDTIARTLKPSQFIIPGFVDTHTHAAQYSFTGSGHGLPLLEWLNTYTFPAEAKLADSRYASSIYNRAVRRHLRCGTTTACYWGSISPIGTLVLCECIKAAGQRASVGQVSMDRNSPDFYIQKTDDSINQAKKFITDVRSLDALIQPIITPRFVPTCTPELMQGLANIAKEENVNIQSHLSENHGEISWVESLHPDCPDYTSVYSKYGLLSKGTIMAHCIHMSDSELALMKAAGAVVAHCPSSNFNLSSGLFNAKRVMDAGITVGLGTDVAGGSSPSILDAIRNALAMSFAQVSSVTPDKTQSNAEDIIDYKCAFYMATQGGADVMSLGDKIGTIEAGKCFDALIIDCDVPDSPFDLFEGETTLDAFQKFLFIGDDRNIVDTFVNGKRIDWQAVESRLKSI